jgi:hypothetical protein
MRYRIRMGTGSESAANPLANLRNLRGSVNERRKSTPARASTLSARCWLGDRPSKLGESRFRLFALMWSSPDVIGLFSINVGFILT